MTAIECCDHCRSIDQCRARCSGLLEPEAGISAKPPVSRNGSAADVATICVAISLFVGLTGALLMSVVGSGA